MIKDDKKRNICTLERLIRTPEQYGGIPDYSRQYINILATSYPKALEEIKNLKQEIETLKTELHYRPDGNGMREAEINFSSTKEKLSEISKKIEMI